MRLTRYETPHLWGRVQYEPGDRLRPDGDTIHLRDPLLLHAGRVQRPEHGQLELTLAGHQRPRLLALRGDNPHLTIRFSGLDAPEAHYVASTRPSATGPAFDLRADRHVNVCQPHFRAAASFLRRTAERARYILVELDRDLTDAHGRVLGYVFTSDASASKRRFLSLELLRRGLAFPFVFESAGDLRDRFLTAAARARHERRGVWRSYRDTPIPYDRAARPSTGIPEETDPIGFLNHPMIFRRVVESAQLRGLPLRAALRKYDVFDHQTGDLVTGDHYQRIPIDRRVWAPHHA